MNPFLTTHEDLQEWRELERDRLRYQQWRAGHHGSVNTPDPWDQQWHPPIPARRHSLTRINQRRLPLSVQLQRRLTEYDAYTRWKYSGPDPSQLACLGPEVAEQARLTNLAARAEWRLKLVARIGCIATMERL